MSNTHLETLSSLSFAGELGIRPETASELSGGVVSTVYAVESTKGPLAVKITRPTPEYRTLEPKLPFTWLDHARLLTPAPDTHAYDHVLLLELARLGANVPIVLGYDHERRATAMRDFRADEYVLMQEKFVKGDLQPADFQEIGRSVATVTTQIQALDPQKFVPVERAPDQFSERFEEFMHFFTYMEKLHSPKAKWAFAQATTGDKLIPTDTHLKNLASDRHGKIMHFDFGRTTFGSPMYPAPNTAAHIALAVIGESLDVTRGISSLEAFSHGVAEVHIQDEELFAIFAVAELLHRASGRWLDPRLLRTDVYTSERRAREVALAVMQAPRPRMQTFVDALRKSVS